MNDVTSNPLDSTRPDDVATTLGEGDPQFQMTMSQSGGPDCTAMKWLSAEKHTPFQSLMEISGQVSTARRLRLGACKLYTTTCHAHAYSKESVR